MATKIENVGWIVLLMVVLSFLSINFQFNLAVIYTIMVVATFMIYSASDNALFNITNNRQDLITSFINGLIGYVLFYIAVSTSVPFIFAVEQPETTQDIISGFVQSAVFSGSQFLNFFSVGFLIPIVESLLFFSALLGFILLTIKVPARFEFDNVGMWVAIGVVSAAFVIFHITAKGITNNRDLFVSFLFAIVSCLMALGFKRAADMIWLHIINNTLAVS